MSYQQSPSVPPLSLSRPLLLGSGSPRRRELLEGMGLPVVVRAPSADERVLEAEPPGAYLERVTAAKLEAVLAGDPPGHAVVLVADTTVVCDGVILGKPETDEEATRMVSGLAGRAHEVMTRFALARRGDRTACHAETVVSRVWVRALDEAWIGRYVATGEGRDKAGAYAIQGLFAAAIPRIEGSYANVVGLPVCEVVAALERLGLLGEFPRVSWT